METRHVPPHGEVTCVKSAGIAEGEVAGYFSAAQWGGGFREFSRYYSAGQQVYFFFVF